MQYKLNEQVILVHTQDENLEGKHGRVLGQYGEGFYIVSVDSFPIESRPWKCIVISEACISQFDMSDYMDKTIFCECLYDVIDEWAYHKSIIGDIPDSRIIKDKLKEIITHIVVNENTNPIDIIENCLDRLIEEISEHT